MSGRTANRRAGRETHSTNEVELDLLNRALESLRKAKERNDDSVRLGHEIVQLEEEIKLSSATKSGISRSTADQLRRLDDLYREKLRRAEDEKKIHDEDDIVNNLAILATMRAESEPTIMTGTRGAPTKGRGKNAPVKPHPILTGDVLESSELSPSEGPSTATSATPRTDLKRKTPHAVVATAATAGPRGRPTGSSTPQPPDQDDTEHHRGLLAEKAGQLVPGTNVFYRFRAPNPTDLGIGIQCIIKKIHHDKKPVSYDVQDPEPDTSTGKQNVHKATARDLVPISDKNENDRTGSVFSVGTTVFARYPDTDTFYKAKVVRSLRSGEYMLRFEGEEDDKEQGVERRFVLDTRMR